MSTSESTTRVVPPATGAPDVSFTELAAAKIREVLEQQELTAEDGNVRVYVAGGSCCGPSFGLAFDSARDDDVSVESHGLSIVIDPMSLPHLQGATVDFIETPEATGFQVTVPRAEGGCSPDACGPSSCGSSGGGCC